MLKLFRRAVYTLIALITILCIALLFYVRGSLPDYSGEYEVQGIKGPVEIVRDFHAVPHIYADHQDDLAFGMGYAMAEDRLWQMDLFRRVATGRLSEIFGKRTIKADRFAKISGFQRESKSLVAELNAAEKSYLGAFVKGVNQYVTTHPDEIPIEFKLLNYEPDLFTEEDIMALSFYKSYVSNHNWKFELLRASAIQELGEQKGRELVAATSFDGPFMSQPGVELKNEGIARIIPFEQKEPGSNDQQASANPLFQALLAVDSQVKQLTGLEANETHSNYWVISGSRSQSGKPIFANDYHMPFLLPSLWYEIHIVGDGIDAMGITMPGSPTILAGHNRDIAWGATTTGADTQDLVWEQLNPDNKNEYLYQGQYHAFVTHQEEIKYRQDGELRSEVILVKASRHGLIINDIIQDQEFIDASHFVQPLAMQSVADAAKGQIGFAMNIYRARDWQEFKQAIGQIRTPIWNWGYADKHGNIGFKINGSVPIRKKGKGLEPKNGWSGEYDWQGYVDFDDLPETYNPPEGFIVSANNEISSNPDSPSISSTIFQLPYRAIQIEELIRSKEKLSQRDMRDIQLDTRSMFGLLLQKEILVAVESSDQQFPRLDPLLKILEEWDGSTDVDSVATSIIQEFFVHLLKHTFANKISDSLFEQLIASGNLNYVASVLLANLNTEGLHHWFDDPATDRQETKQDTIIQSLIDAEQSLSEYFGHDIRKWRWGKLHQTYFQHQMGKVVPFKWFLNIGPDEYPGDISTINPGTFHDISQKPYRSVHGASMRHVIDFAQPAKADLVLTTGQSGRWPSANYKDQAALWNDGQYLNIQINKASLLKNNRGITTFSVLPH